MQINYLYNKSVPSYQIAIVTVLLFSFIILPYLDRKARQKKVEVLSSDNNLSYNKLTILTLRLTRGLLIY